MAKRVNKRYLKCILVNALTLSICKASECRLNTYQNEIILKWATTFEVTTVSPILYISVVSNSALGFLNNNFSEVVKSFTMLKLNFSITITNIIFLNHSPDFFHRLFIFCKVNSVISFFRKRVLNSNMSATKCLFNTFKIF